MKKYLTILFAVISAVLLSSCAREINWSSLAPEDPVLTIGDAAYTFDQLRFSYAEEKVAYDIVNEYYNDGALDFEDYELSMNRVFNDFQCKAVLSALADMEGNGLSAADAAASAKETYIDSAELMPAFDAYLGKIKEELAIDDTALVDYGALSVKLYADSSKIAEREYTALLAENPGISKEDLANKLAARLAEITKSISVKNAVTKMKIIPNFTDFAVDFVDTHNS